MLSLLKKRSRLILIFIPLIAGVLQIKHFTTGAEAKLLEENSFILDKIDFLNGADALIVYHIVLIIFLSLLTFLFIFIVNRIKIFEYNSFLHGFIFLFIIESNFSIYNFLPALAAGTFLILSVNIMLGSVRKDLAVFDFFNAGFLISVGSLFYINLIFFFILLFASLIILRPFAVKEWFASIIGIISPYWLTFIILFLINENFDFFFNFIGKLHAITPEYIIKLPSYIFYSFIAFILILATVNIGSRFQNFKIDMRAYLKIFFVLFLISAFVFVLLPSAGFEILIFASFSVSIPITMFFNKIKRKVVAEILFDIMLILFIYKIYEL